MSDFQEILRECVETKGDNENFTQNLERLYKNSQVKSMIKKYQATYSLKEDDVKESIKEYIEEKNCGRADFSTFRRDIQNDCSLIAELKEEAEAETHKNIIKPFNELFSKQSTNDKHSQKGEQIAKNLLSIILDLIDKERIDDKDFFNSLINKTGLDPKYRQRLDYIFKELGKYHPKDARAIKKKLITFNIYTRLVNYIMKDKKLQVDDLILDFNKIRDYLSIILNDKSIKTKQDLIKRCPWKKENSCDKEITRISKLFKIDTRQFFEEDFNEYKPNELARVYDIHTVPNLVINFIILDIIQAQPEFKRRYIMKQLFPETIEEDEPINTECDCGECEDCKKRKNKAKKELIEENFRKNTLIPRLNEMEEYGFITKMKNTKDKYLFSAKFLSDEQKTALQKVVPFFCGFYPFTSIGHALANRLSINDLFEIKPCNLSNLLDDCITYDLLEAIDKNEPIKLLLKGKEKKYKKFEPTELFIEKESNLLKFRDNKNEYYLHEISIDKNSKNPVFNEIYSFYYKTFADSVKQFKKDRKEQLDILRNEAIKDGTLIIAKDNKKDFSEYIPSTYKKIFHKNTFNNLLPMLAKLDKVVVPLTTLELRWLKTIMQDVRFDLFVTDEEKESLAELVKDVEQFNLSSFKVYDNKTKTYKCITDFGMPEGINKDIFRKKIKELNKKLLFNIDTNSFANLS